MKYLLIFLAFSGTTLLADTYQGKNGNKVAHNRAGTAVQTSNGTAVHARGSSTVRATNGAYHAGGTMGPLCIGTVQLLSTLVAIGTPAIGAVIGTAIGTGSVATGESQAVAMSLSW